MMRAPENIQIRPPTPEDWPALCRMLTKVWPFEEWMWDGTPSGLTRLYRWRSVCAFLAGEPVGNVSRSDITIRLRGRPKTIAAIASVATAEEHRRKGVARRLLAEILKGVDADGLPALLFTGLPRVYEAHGFQTLPQNYPTLTAAMIPLDTPALSARQIEILEEKDVARMARIYESDYPDYDGKVARDADYLEWYRAFFNNSSADRIILAERGADILGYLRLLDNDDCIIVTEFCCGANAVDVTQALLGFTREAAEARCRKLITLALPPAHFLYHFLRARNIPAAPKPLASLGLVMARGPRGSSPSQLEGLVWCLADRF